ncbi:hypothetical protein EBO15_33255 [Actinomadura harenae]|uniref:Uncharacterized protein n=1 Tax=Actinomadura harenae TaxID=2483351 RepID=A0A3M2LN54_9ACTN|nr:hypothetical protein EBO15_33255 [Actinomadura harenae]
MPVTLGRDPGLAPAAAQALAWAARDRPPGSFLLADPLGTVTHLVGWLRSKVTGILRGGDFTGAVLLVAPPADPEADAELFKVARLVWQYLPVRWVEVALAGDESALAEGVDRCLRLGADEVVVVPASLVPPPACPPGGRDAGPLLGPAALAALIAERATQAERRWERDGDDGLRMKPHHGHGHTLGRTPEPTTETPEGTLTHG